MEEQQKGEECLRRSEIKREMREREVERVVERERERERCTRDDIESFPHCECAIETQQWIHLKEGIMRSHLWDGREREEKRM